MQFRFFVLAAASLATASFVLASLGDVKAHGDVTPQAVDTSALPDIGEEWLEENPWRDPATPEWKVALQVGASGYNQNCARCHGLEAISGGLAPDLRYLEANIDGDEWYLERYQNGYTQNGITKMPAFGDLLGQKAAWAIRSYIEARPDDGALDEHSDRLKEIRDQLKTIAASDKSAADAAVEIAPLREEMDVIAKSIVTASQAPVADSAASRAVALLDGSQNSLVAAAEALTVGLSAAE
ncbi:MAG: cytochrome c-550 PedF [Hyphomicrobiales bacterium]